MHLFLEWHQSTNLERLIILNNVLLALSFTIRFNDKQKFCQYGYEYFNAHPALKKQKISFIIKSAVEPSLSIVTIVIFPTECQITKHIGNIHTPPEHVFLF